MSCSHKKVKIAVINTSKTILMFWWLLISGVGTQTKNKDFSRVTYLCSVHITVKMQATDV